MTISQTQEPPKYISAKYLVRLIPITPIHVWSGIDAVVGVNAFIHDKNFYIIEDRDFDKLTSEELTRVVSILVNSSKSVEALHKIFKILLDRKVLKPIPVKAKDIKQYTTVKLIHPNIIPGSELKGYLRTAVIRYLLTKQITKQQISNILRKRKNLHEKQKTPRVGEKLENILLRTNRLEVQGGFVDALELILVSDPVVENVSFSVRTLYVLEKTNPNPQNYIARVNAVVLDNAERIEFEIAIVNQNLNLDRIVPKERDKELPVFTNVINMKNKFVRDFSNQNTFLEILRNHGCKVIDLELNKLPQSSIFNDYKKLLSDLKTQLCRDGEKCVPARIGFMTGHEAKTVLDVVKDQNLNLYKDIVNYMTQRLKHKWDALTLKLVEHDDKLLGVGWCKLCLQEYSK